MALKRYSDKEPLVYLYVMIPYIGFMNLLFFGTCLFSSILCFLKAFGISAVYFFTVYGLFGSVAVFIKNKYSGAGDLFKRISIMLPVFYIMNVFAVAGAHLLYSNFKLVECEVLHHLFWWTVLYACIMSTVITFINEGIANWEKWKNSLAESEKLKSAYQRSKLLGLKGQINPHFLFNCFNTLSGLLHVDTEKAETFLDEMTKVHRYLLRGDDEYLVSLQDELKFATSYLNLIKARFGEAIDISVDVPSSLLLKKMPPLSMQVILENIIYTNALHKKQPLALRITGDVSGKLLITHSVHEKIIVQDLDVDEGLDNLVTKYRLMNAAEVRVTETGAQREIVLPLFDQNSIAA
jgi:sensor histidine kinase YesM